MSAHVGSLARRMDIYLVKQRVEYVRQLERRWWDLLLLMTTHRQSNWLRNNKFLQRNRGNSQNSLAIVIEFKKEKNSRGSFTWNECQNSGHSAAVPRFHRIFKTRSSNELQIGLVPQHLIRLFREHAAPRMIKNNMQSCAPGKTKTRGKACRF